MVVLLIALIIGCYAWLRSGPISNEELTKMLADALSAPDGSYSATVEAASLNWQDISELGTVRVERVVLRDADGNIFANFPRLRATLNPLAWVIGGQKISELAMLRPQLYVQKNLNGEWALGFGGDAGQGVPLAGILTPFSGDEHAKSGPGVRGFDRLMIYGAQLYISDEQAGTVLSSTAADIRAVRSGRSLEVQLRAPFTYNKMTTTIAAAAVVDNNGESIAADVRLNRAPLSLVCKFMQCPEGTGASGSFTGRIAPAFMQGALSELKVQGQGEDLKIDLPEWFEESLDIPRVRIDAAIMGAGKKLVLRAAEATLGTDTQVRLRGVLTKAEAGYGLEAYGETIAPMHIKHLRKYWPITAAPATRTWVNAMLSKGTATNAHAYISLKPGEMDLPHMPDSALSAQVQTTGMTVKYLPGFPVVKNFTGTVYFTGETLRVDGTSAEFMDGSKLGTTTLTCDDLYHPNVPMSVSMTLDAAAGDAAKLLALEHFAFDDALKLDSTAIKGRITGSLQLGFNTFSDGDDDGKPHFENVTYDTTLRLADIAQPGFADAFSVSGFNGDLTARTGLFTLAGAGMFDGHTLTVDLSQKDGGALRAGVVGTLSAKAVRELAGSQAAWVTDGALGVDIALDYRGKKIAIQHAKVDATGAALAVPEISFKKAIGEKGSVSLTQADDAKTLTLKAQLGKLSANGSVRANADTGSIERVNITRLTAPGNDFSMSYSTQGDGFIVDLKGKALDARDSYASTENGLLADFPNMRLNLDLESLLLYELPITQLKGYLDCLPGACVEANMSGIVGKGNISARILRENAQRKLEIDSGDAGDLLKAFDITDRMFDGKMEVRGTYDDAQEPAPLTARLQIHDFTLKNSQILARLFSIGSLSGLANALTGSGIEFDKFASTIVAKKGVFKLTDGQAKGNAMGFTVKGTVDTTTASLKLKGVLVPAFFLNSFIGKIPIIGELAGGEGEGLIAFNYSIKGPYADPETSVNPLSGLTPGFLRGIFSAFDAPAEEVRPVEEKDDATEAAPVDPGQTPPPATPQVEAPKN